MTLVTRQRFVSQPYPRAWGAAGLSCRLTAGDVSTAVAETRPAPDFDNEAGQAVGGDWVPAAASECRGHVLAEQ